MNYISSRGRADMLGFEDTLLTGLARDGGLYIPESWPQWSADDIRALRGLPYWEVATRVMLPFLGGAIKDDDFADMTRETYAVFNHEAVAPLVQLAPDQWLMELFHGPTLAFKDYALQLVGRLFDHVLNTRGQRITIVGATSGDTGSAAIAACLDKAAVEIFILHPHNRVSEVQRRQMTTVTAANVHNIALEGSFDDCQDLVKGLFNDGAFRDRHGLSAVNSINWARIMGQIVYYAWAAVQLGAPERNLAFAVPTGNFGNVYAGYGARKMGFPITDFLVGSNRNDILTRFFDSGIMEMAPVEPSLSPSMDIQVSSNFERLLHDVYTGDEAALEAAMTDFRKTGGINFGEARWREIRKLFNGHALDDAQTSAMIRTIHETTGQLLDPHTAVGVAAARALPRSPGSAVVALATAHPAKFPDAVEAASGVRPGLPTHLSDLLTRDERFTVLDNDLESLKAHIAAQVGSEVPA